MSGTCLLLVAGQLNSGVVSGKSNLLSWNKTVLRQRDTGGDNWVSHSLKSQARSKSLPWIMESVVLLQCKSILWCLFCQQRAQFDQRCLCRHQRRQAWGCGALCVCMYMCIYVLLWKQFTFMDYLFPSSDTYTVFSRILQFLHSPRDFHLVIPWTFPISHPRSNAP